MAKQRSRRQRSQRSTPTGVVNETDTSTVEVPTEVERVGVRKMAGLSPEQIQALLGKTRSKGQYIKLLNEFIESGLPGVDVQEQWMELRDKVGNTLKQGFDNAREHKDANPAAEHVKVISQKEGEGDAAVQRVYLINMASEDLAEQAEAA